MRLVRKKVEAYGCEVIRQMVLAGLTITKPAVVKLGMGGLCLECDVCRYPACAFGTGT